MISRGSHWLSEAPRGFRIEFLLERCHFWDWLAGEGCSLEASLSPDEKHFFIISMHFCRTVVLHRKISASSTVWSPVNSQCVSWNMDVHRHLIRDVHQQHSWDRFSKKILFTAIGPSKGTSKGTSRCRFTRVLESGFQKHDCSRARSRLAPGWKAYDRWWNLLGASEKHHFAVGQIPLWLRCSWCRSNWSQEHLSWFHQPTWPYFRASRSLLGFPKTCVLSLYFPVIWMEVKKLAFGGCCSPRCRRHDYSALHTPHAHRCILRWSNTMLLAVNRLSGSDDV